MTSVIVLRNWLSLTLWFWCKTLTRRGSSPVLLMPFQGTVVIVPYQWGHEEYTTLPCAFSFCLISSSGSQIAEIRRSS